MANQLSSKTILYDKNSYHLVAKNIFRNIIRIYFRNILMLWLDL